jgi:glutamine cyclotransferase
MLSLTKPQQIAYALAEVSIEELEAFIYQGYAYAVSADHEAAVLTSPWADDDVKH